MRRQIRMATWTVATLLGLGAFAFSQNYDRDRDDFRRSGYYGERYGANVGFGTGRADGAQTAREDLYHAKPFNPNPRGRFGGMDHNYRREFGDKGYYRSQYAAGYRSGYEAVFGSRPPYYYRRY
jgi:hypothetical protein